MPCFAIACLGLQDTSRGMQLGPASLQLGPLTFGYTVSDAVAKRQQRKTSSSMAM